MTILKSFSYVFLIIFWIIQIKVVALHQKSKKYDMEQNVKELPYGVQDFVTIVEQNIYYVDKTMYIPELEKQARNLFFIRPRRFGKSVFLSMLHAYYDCLSKDKFQEWFGDLWIGKHPTSLQARYQILHLDFSQVGGDIDELERKFNFYMGVELDAFVRDYHGFYSEKLRQDVYATEDATGKLALIQSEARAKRYPLYLIIDEYDNYYDMAYDGKWHDALQYMADAYAQVSSVRDSIAGERNLQGFFMAYLNLNAYYYTAPELELNHGYCDFFLLPDLTHYATKHSYILELKLVPKREKGMSEETYQANIKKQWQQAEVQIKQYAVAPRVEALRQGTTLHKIIMQFDGWNLLHMDEVH